MKNKELIEKIVYVGLLYAFDLVVLANITLGSIIISLILRKVVK